MKKLYLSFLWHQHQPYYKDDADGFYHMPWVYLHALKDYYEMAIHVERSNIKATFNYVPSLLIQLRDYANYEVQDNFLIMMRKKVAALTTEERRLVANQCFMANYHTMIRPLKRFDELYLKQQAKSGDMLIFTDEELVDLEVLYIISWCGQYLRQEDEHLKYLLSKGSNFSEDEKCELLRRAASWMERIVQVHKGLQDRGRIEVSCTPFFHPILPLLIDITSAKEICPDMPMPSFDTNLSNDASWHVLQGLNEFESTFGFRPRGMWPAEGSVSQRAVERFAEHGVEWIASDEEVLGNSLLIDIKDPGNRFRLYQKHFQVHNGKKINIFFRDKPLSDLIGFTYSSWNEDDAVNDFISHLRGIYDSVQFSPHVSIILDGENAWEYYRDNAFHFFTKLYSRLSQLDWLETQTFSEAVANYDIPEESVQNIRAGSWIMGNFRIWIGHQEKNKAWELLGKTKNAIDKYIDTVSKEEAEQVYKELHIAEGSDWFWWFGDDHFSMQSDLFDKLFRTHLINIHRLLKLNVPSEFFLPIKSGSKTGLLQRATSYITPEIVGKRANFYEWLGSALYDLKADAGSMHSGGNALSKLSFGFDTKKLYLALDVDFSSLKVPTICQIDVTYGDSIKTFDIDLSKKSGSQKNGLQYAIDQFLEVAIPLNNFEGADKVCLGFKLLQNNLIVEKAPLYNAVEVFVGDTFKDEWII